MLYQWEGMWYGPNPGEVEAIPKVVIAETEEDAKKKFYEMCGGNPKYPLLCLKRIG